MNRFVDKTVLLSAAVLAAFAIGAAQQHGQAASTGQSCEQLKELKLADTTILTAEAQAAGTFSPPARGGAAPAPARGVQGQAAPAPARGGGPGAQPVAAAFCRVTGSIKPTSDSDVRFELWLPASNWNGRYQSVGNGGFAGGIRYDEMTAPILAGTAVASTDDGHSTPGAGWALNHPEKIADYGYRAVHVTAETAKAITAAFYGSQPKYSYFVGCSKGGGEAFMEAQRYPKDFDGIVGAANANMFTDLFSSFAWEVTRNLESKDGYLSGDDIAKMGQYVLEQCDAADGVKDGLITNPFKCNPDLSKAPLSPAQIKTYQAIREGLKNSAGKVIYPGKPYGSEAGWRGSISGPSYDEALARSQQGGFGNGYLANFVYNDPMWDPKKFDADKTPMDAAKANGQALNALDTQFTEFKKRGGKYIQWHGLSDPLVTVNGSIEYYQKVVAAQAGKKPGEKLDAKAYAKTQDFYRLFLAPGVNHCGGGPGPNQLGQAGGNGDAQHDAVAAMYQWVEKGVAPKSIIATKYNGDNQANGVAMTRPLCPYPQMAKYKGTGDTNDATNFVCAAE
jgi:feruloyl esterase